MPAKYRFFKRPKTLLKEGVEATLYPRIVDGKKVSFHDFFPIINQSSSLTEGDCAAALNAFGYYAVQQLLMGNRVHWPGFGSFHVTLDCDPITDPKSIRAESIKGKTVVFVPDHKLLQKVRHIEIESAGPYVEKKKFDQDQRWDRAYWYLSNKEDTITSAILMSLNDCSRKVAQQDLRKWTQTGWVRQMRSGYYVYTLNNKEEKS